MQSTKTITLYIPNCIQMAEPEDYLRSIFSDIKGFEYFKWKLEIDSKHKDKSELVVLLQNLQSQVINWFKQLNDGVKVNLIISGLSQIVISEIYDLISDKINKLILISPFDNTLFLRAITLKRKIFPSNKVDAVYKYIYFCDSLKDFRHNKTWLKAIDQESKLYQDFNLIYHKLFDQLIKYKKIKYYLLWLNNIIQKEYVFSIIGTKNPIINIREIKFLENYLLIEGAGFCIWWEKPNILKQLILMIIK